MNFLIFNAIIMVLELTVYYNVYLANKILYYAYCLLIYLMQCALLILIPSGLEKCFGNKEMLLPYGLIQLFGVKKSKTKCLILFIRNFKINYYSCLFHLSRHFCHRLSIVWAILGCFQFPVCLVLLVF